MNFEPLADMLPQLAFALAMLVIVIIALNIWRGRQVKRGSQQPDLTIDLVQLGVSAPPAGPSRLEVYGTPVRLRVVVIAPAGRHQSSVHPEDIPILLNQFMPGLLEIFQSHQPLCRCWPAQLSSQGFAQSFLNHVSLPGNRGKGTPWTSIVGKFHVGEQIFLIGIVCCSETSNSLSQFIVEHEGQWFDTLRIRQEQ
ncbi:MAG: hypothetical protein VB857_08750 [Pirellulaceae bacterium]